MLDLDQLSLEEIADALQDQNQHGHIHLINPETGELLYWTEDLGIDGRTPMDIDELDKLGLVPIDPIPSYVWYQDMVDFAEGISDDRVGRRLGRALDGKGAFRRFRDVLEDEDPRLLAAWYALRGARGRCRAVEWLLDNSLIDDAAAQRYFEEHPEPELP